MEWISLASPLELLQSFNTLAPDKSQVSPWNFE